MVSKYTEIAGYIKIYGRETYARAYYLGDQFQYRVDWKRSDWAWRPVLSDAVAKRFQPKCEVCGKFDETVSVHYCEYEREVNRADIVESICDACESTHADEV